MSYRRILQFACFALCLLAPAMASAAGKVPWIEGSLGGSTYAMGDINDEIAEINVDLAGSNLKMDEITKGLSYGLAFGLDLGNSFSIGLGYDRLTGRSEVGDATGSLEFDLAANLLRGFGRYSFQNTGKARGFVEASLGLVSSAGTATETTTGFAPDFGEFDGSGFAGEGSGGYSYWTSPKLALTGALGFRFAKIDNVESGGSPIYTSSGKALSIDYTGVFARLGLTVVLTP